MNDRIFLRKYRISTPVIDPEEKSESQSSVHQGVEIETGRKVLIETYPAVSITSSAREQLQADADAAKKLHHINVPALYDFGIENDELVYVSQYFDGTVAEDWVKRYGPMPASPVLHIASQVVSALSAAAFHRIIHHNINPGDLLLSPGETADGQWPLVKVLHLTGAAPPPSKNGSAASDSNRLTPYASPEQDQHEPPDFPAEMYSLGSTMWFLLTGTLPPIQQTDPPSKNDLSPQMLNAVPKSVRDLLEKMLAASPDARPGDPLAFSRLLQDCTAHLHGGVNEPAPAPVSTSKKRPPPGAPDEYESQWNRKRVLVVVAVPVVIVVAGLFAFYEYSRPHRPMPAQKPARAPVNVVTNATPVPIVVPVVVPETKKSFEEKTAATENIRSNVPQVKSDLVQRASINLSMPPAWPRSLSLFRVPRPPEAGYGPPSFLGPIPEAKNSAVASTQVEVPTTGHSLSGKTTEVPPPKKVTSKRSAASTSPEVRKGEAAPPAEGPTEKAKPTPGAKSSPNVRDNARR